MALLHLLTTLFFAAIVCSLNVIDLSGSDWTLENRPLNVCVPASVPSQVHLDLYAAQVINDPYATTNQSMLLRLTSGQLLRPE